MTFINDLASFAPYSNFFDFSIIGQVSNFFDFGTIDKGANGVHTFVLTNTGDNALVISKCEKTCGCTIPKCNPAPISPGKSSQVVVTYDTERLGPFNKTVKVHTNDPDRPVIHLRIKGTVAT